MLTAATLCTSSSERHENTTLTEVSTAGKKDVKGVASVRTQLSTRTAVCVDEWRCCIKHVLSEEAVWVNESTPGWPGTSSYCDPAKGRRNPRMHEEKRRSGMPWLGWLHLLKDTALALKVVHRRLLQRGGKVPLYRKSIVSLTLVTAAGCQYSRTKEQRGGGATQAHLFSLLPAVRNGYKAGMIPLRLEMRKLPV